jgi:hypothetical protein
VGKIPVQYSINEVDRFLALLKMAGSFWKFPMFLSAGWKLECYSGILRTIQLELTFVICMAPEVLSIEVSW